MAGRFDFPNPVNEVAARAVAAGVLILTAATVSLAIAAGPGWLWLSVVLAYGFLARVLAGPRWSPLGLLATRVLAPRLGRATLVPGPPKRFAQGIGAVVTVSAATLHFAFAADTAAVVLLILIVVAATLESVFAYCVGCRVFAVLMSAGLVPQETCAACADLSAQPARSGI